LCLFFQKIVELAGFKWFTSDGLPPKDSPECGFYNELCPLPPLEGLFRNWK